jgi:peptidoglycan/xylan/chitin deacetylase (PgdA/CDA1 family)
VVGVCVLAVLLAFSGLLSSSGHRGAQSFSTTSTSTSKTTTAPTTTTTTLPIPVAIPGGTLAPVYYQIPTRDPVVFFTIDDGIVRDPAVIEYLRVEKIPVTMFPVPTYVHQDLAYFQAIHDLGASVQDHTQTHPDLRRLSVAAQQREICGPLDDYTAVFGTRPWIFRPPNGAMTSSVPTIARHCGIRVIVLWRATMNDGVLRTQDGGPLQPGDIILMHFRSDLRQNLEVALDAAHAAGLHPAPLEQYLTPQ